MLTPDEKLLAGVSGGADSVALLDVLVKSGFRPHVCHLNHQLRGADSDADAEFVRELAGKYGLPCTIELVSSLVGAASRPRPEQTHRGREAAPTVPVERGGGLENICRQARIEFFTAVAQRTGIAKLALAHTADDQVETFLLRLLRGAGMPGLVGIWPERQIGSLRVIRPLLKVRRAEILEYLAAEKLAHREDATNTDTRFTRNRIRHELLPLLEREYNPAIRDVLARTAEILRDEDELLAKLTESVMEGHAPSWPHPERTQLFAAKGWASLQIETLRDQPVALQRRALRAWLGVELDFEQIEAVRELAQSDSPSAQFDLPDELVVYREYHWLKKALREELEPVRGRWSVNMTGATLIKELNVSFDCHPELVEGSLPKKPEMPRQVRHDNPKEEHLDADALGESLFVRTWQEGDRFQPLGMSVEKKLQDFFVDEKLPRRQRARTPLLCADDGRIAWVVGCRIAEPFKVTEHTRCILQVHAEKL